MDQFLTLEKAKIGPVFNSTAYIYIYFDPPPLRTQKTQDTNMLKTRDMLPTGEMLNMLKNLKGLPTRKVLKTGEMLKTVKNVRSFLGLDPPPPQKRDKTNPKMLPTGEMLKMLKI